jgi:hypothetical protein
MEMVVLRRRISRNKAKRHNKKTGASSHVQAYLQQLLFLATYRKTSPTAAQAGEKPAGASKNHAGPDVPIGCKEVSYRRCDYSCGVSSRDTGSFPVADPVTHSFICGGFPPLKNASTGKPIASIFMADYEHKF